MTARRHDYRLAAAILAIASGLTLGCERSREPSAPTDRIAADPNPADSRTPDVQPAGPSAPPPFRCDDYAPSKGPHRFECGSCEPCRATPQICAGDRACIVSLGTPILVRPGWEHFWRLDQLTTSKCVAGGLIYEELPDVLALDGLREVDVSCALAPWMPAVFGAKDEWITVSIPAEAGLRRPRSTSADDAALEWARLRLARPPALPDDERPEHRAVAQAEPVFSKAERAKMRASTFVQPTLRVLQETVVRDGVAWRTRLFVLFSPESAQVYLLDASYEAPPEDLERHRLRSIDGLVDVERTKDGALDPWLRSTGVERVRVAVGDACVIPESLGGRRWGTLVPSASGKRVEPAGP